MLTLFQMVGASFIFTLLLMVTLWCIYYVRRNAGIVDIGWAAGFLIVMVIYFLLGNGDWLKSTILLLMVGIWSGRLCYMLCRRYVEGIEDPRYRDIRDKWGDHNSDFKFLILFVFQGVLIVILSIPFLVVSCCPEEEWSVWEVLGLFVWSIGVAGSYFADEQLRAFKLTPGSDLEVCNVGLWRYSRHPNYFFEWIVWVGYFLYALSASWGFIALLSPALMYYLLRYVSGVPMVEAHLLKTRGDGYRRYQATTSEFFPWFSRKAQ